MPWRVQIMLAAIGAATLIWFATATIRQRHGDAYWWTISAIIGLLGGIVLAGKPPEQIKDMLVAAMFGLACLLIGSRYLKR